MAGHHVVEDGEISHSGWPVVSVAASCDLRRPDGLDGTFQIAGKAEPSRNRQRAAVGESRGT